MVEFLELTPVEYHPAEWRKCTAFVEHLKSTKGDIGNLEEMSPEEEATVRFGFWCYQVGWKNGMDDGIRQR